MPKKSSGGIGRIKKRRYSRTRDILEAKDTDLIDYRFTFRGLSKNRARVLRKALGRQGKLTLLTLTTAYYQATAYCDSETTIVLRIFLEETDELFEKTIVEISAIPEEEDWQPEPPPTKKAFMLH
jgi:hypothetical protein